MATWPPSSGSSGTRLKMPTKMLMAMRRRSTSRMPWLATFPATCTRPTGDRKRGWSAVDGDDAVAELEARLLGRALPRLEQRQLPHLQVGVAALDPDGGEGDEQQHEGDQEVHRRARDGDREPPPVRLFAVGAGLVLGG